MRAKPSRPLVGFEYLGAREVTDARRRFLMLANSTHGANEDDAYPPAVWAKSRAFAVNQGGKWYLTDMGRMLWAALKEAKS